MPTNTQYLYTLSWEDYYYSLC